MPAVPRFLIFQRLTFLLVIASAASCMPYRGGSGGGADDDDYVDDDDEAPDSGPAELALQLGNETGYDIIHFTLALWVEGELFVESGWIDFPDGTSYETSTHIEEVTYGTAMSYSAFAVDVDEWCLRVSDTVSVEAWTLIDAEFSMEDYLGSYYEIEQGLCGEYTP